MVDFYTSAAGDTMANPVPKPVTNLPTVIQPAATEAPGFMSRLPSLRAALGGIPGAVAGLAGVPIAQSVGTAAGNFYNGVANGGAGSPELQAYNAAEQARLAQLNANPNIPTGTKVGQAVRSYADVHSRLLGENFQPVSDALGGAGNFVAGLFGGTGESSTTTPKINQAAAQAAAPATETDTRPVIKMSDLPRFNMAQLKMLQPYMTKQPGPADNLKSGYLTVIAQQHAQALAMAGSDPAKIAKANDQYRKSLVPLFAGSAGSTAVVMPGYEAD